MKHVIESRDIDEQRDLSTFLGGAKLLVDYLEMRRCNILDILIRYNHEDIRWQGTVYYETSAD